MEEGEEEEWMYEGEGMEREEWEEDEDEDDDEDEDENEDEGEDGECSAGIRLTDINGNPEKVSSPPPPSSSPSSSSSSQRNTVGRSSSGKSDSSGSSSSSKSKSRDATRPTVVSKGVVDAEGNIEKLDEFHYTDEVPVNVTAMLGGGGGQDILDDHGGVSLPQ